MKKELQEIIDKYKEFKQYLEGIDNSVFENSSRTELIDFENELRSTNSFRYISLEVDKTVKKKKEEEYPELLGVHHYPVIKEIDFISEEDKIALDTYLVKLGFRSYIHKYSNAWREVSKHWRGEIGQDVLNFLVEKGIIELLYRVEVCHEKYTMDKEKMDKYFRYFELEEKSKTQEEWDEYFELTEEIELGTYCDECDEDVKITKEMLVKAQNSPGCYVYKLLKERDKSLDNV